MQTATLRLQTTMVISFNNGQPLDGAAASNGVKRNSLRARFCLLLQRGRALTKKKPRTRSAD
jgi:hypothetical protein